MPPARKPANPRGPRPRQRPGSPPPTRADRRPSRQQRRQAARAEHAALRAKRQRRRRRLRIALPLAGGMLVAIATLIALATLHRSATHPAGASASQLPGLQTGPAPWTANTGGLAARLRAIGLPPLSQMEASDLHTHQHLDLDVDGHRVQVPALVGIDPAAGLAPLHVHDTSGVIHVESPVVRTYTLGQFFAVWGVRFSPTCLGGYCTNPTRQLRVYVNGQPDQADPTMLALAPTRKS